MEWVPVIERVGFPIAMVLMLVVFITGVGAWFLKFLWDQFFLPVKEGLMASFQENSETNQAILKQVQEQGILAQQSHTKIIAVADRQSGFHEFLSKAGGYERLLNGGEHAKANGEKLDRIEKKVDVVVKKLVVESPE